MGVILGKALNQKEAIGFLIDHYSSALKDEEKTQFDTFVKALDAKNEKLKNSARNLRYLQKAVKI